MKNEQNTKELYISPKANFRGYDYECVCCGKKLTENHNLWIIMNEDWVAVNPEIAEEDIAKVTGAESQGVFQIGNECAKKMKGFTFTN